MEPVHIIKFISTERTTSSKLKSRDCPYFVNTNELAHHHNTRGTHSKIRSTSPGGQATSTTSTLRVGARGVETRELTDSCRVRFGVAGGVLCAARCSGSVARTERRASEGRRLGSVRPFSLRVGLRTLGSGGRLRGGDRPGAVRLRRWDGGPGRWQGRAAEQRGQGSYPDPLRRFLFLDQSSRLRGRRILGFRRSRGWLNPASRGAGEARERLGPGRAWNWGRGLSVACDRYRD